MLRVENVRSNREHEPWSTRVYMAILKTMLWIIEKKKGLPRRINGTYFSAMIVQVPEEKTQILLEKFILGSKSQV